MKITPNFDGAIFSRLTGISPDQWHVDADGVLHAPDSVKITGELIRQCSPGPSPEQREARQEDVIQNHLDATARARTWDSIYTASLRAGYAGPYQAEGIAFARWMDAVWVRAIEVRNEVVSGKRKEPTDDELIALLPPPPTFVSSPVVG